MKKHTVYLMGILALLLLVISGCSTTQKIENIKEAEVSQKEVKVDKEVVVVKKGSPLGEEQFKLHLISTTNNKGTLFPYDVVEQVDRDYSLMSVANYTNSLKKSGEQVLLLNSGNNLSVTPLLYYFNNIDVDGKHILPALYNELGYDVVSVGQRDIEAKEELYTRVLSESNFPYVGANIVDEVTNTPVLEPYVMINKGDVSIAVLGLTDPSGTSWFLDGIAVNDMVETALQWIPIIREKEQADLIVALVSTESDDFSKMAKEVVSLYGGGFDVIIGGMSEVPVIAKDVDGKDVYIVGSMSKAASVNHLEVVFDHNKKEGTYTLSSMTSQSVSMKDIEPDTTLLDSYVNKTADALSWAQSKVVKISEPLSSRDALFKDSAFTDSIHALQRALTSSDISIASPLVTDTIIEKGDVRVADIFKLYNQNDHIYTFSLTGEEILKMATYSYGGWFSPMAALEDDLIRFKKDAAGDFIYNGETNSFETYRDVREFDSFSGINYVVNIARPGSVQVVIKTLENGNAFSSKNTYTVALNSYRAGGGGGHLHAAGITKEMAKSKLLGVSEKDIIYYLLRESKKYNTIELSYDNNWLVIPSLWSTNGMQNSYPKLFGEMLK